MQKIKFFKQSPVPVEFHKPVMVQALQLPPVEKRLEAILTAGCNTFLLNTAEIFLDMLTDSGTNAMSNQQFSAMMLADEAYAGSQSFVRLLTSVRKFFGKEHFLPVHQGRAAEHILAEAFVKKGDVVPMNFHFTTTRAHIERMGATVRELIVDEVFQTDSDKPFKGNMDIAKLEATIKEVGVEKIPFIRMEVTTNLTGGQPVSLANLRAVKKVADKHSLLLVIDACLIAENAWFIKQREPEFVSLSLTEIIHEMTKLADIVYFSARKLGAARGGGIVTNDNKLIAKMKDLIPLFEGFFTYGGMSTREIEALAVGLKEFTDERVISHMPQSISHVVSTLQASGLPMVTPAGALGVHLDAKKFLPQVKGNQYPAGALAVAIFITAGVRGMERGTISNDRDPVTHQEILADMELVRLALPRRLFSLSHLQFLIDRLQWLFANRELIGGLKFVEEPSVLRFFDGKLAPIGDWPNKLQSKFKKDFGESL